MNATEFKLLRKKAKLTQAELAVLMGVHRETILNIENGTTPIKKATETFMLTITGPDKSRNTLHSSESEVEYGHKKKRYAPEDMNLVTIGTSSTSSTSLELICEILSVVTSEPLESVKARARLLMNTKAKSVEDFLSAVF